MEIKMNIKEIIKELIHHNIIQSRTIEYEKLNGGTVSELYLLHNYDGTKFVVKLNEKQILKSEMYFLDFYKKLNLLPNLLFVEQSYNYIVYSFISGKTNFRVKNKQEMLTTLVDEAINNYKTVPNVIGFGYTDELTDSWEAFLLNEIIEVNKLLKPHLPGDEYNFVLNVLENLKNQDTEREKYLLHGDCGVHNFIYNDGELRGVIDPTPVIGYPLYDLIYAFCSSPNDLTIETIDSAVSHLVIKGEKNTSTLYDEVIIGLYLRLGACIKHHPYDFEKYLNAWYFWKKLSKTVQL
ncbi:phosphotransferase [Alkalicoccus saliphilus]|uniref:Aminoglycoside phosphotransferase n=1 Tax=Alkalicoccus saliphilus TaxID=200989 RepID=A0A2T4U5M3_9BACI|nr:phosphotransferase [Alkalicoccus saliphilus]PTL38690.1 aminoglycoside phosphotransferase [Alkalicoccus saliphilus]